MKILYVFLTLVMLLHFALYAVADYARAFMIRSSSKGRANINIFKPWRTLCNS
jgi:hypothetical protein